MAIKITDECINCGACEPECPNNAIYESGVGWIYADGTSLKEVEERNQSKKLSFSVQCFARIARKTDPEFTESPELLSGLK